MARFLSSEWFAEVETVDAAAVSGEGSWVLEQVVTATPQGDVRYQLVAADGNLCIRRATATAVATVTFTSDYPTAVAIARGQLSTQAALLDGRIRVSGDLSGIADALRQLSGLDLVPAGVRATTTY